MTQYKYRHRNNTRRFQEPANLNFSEMESITKLDTMKSNDISESKPNNYSYLFKFCCARSTDENATDCQLDDDDHEMNMSSSDSSFSIFVISEEDCPSGCALASYEAPESFNCACLVCSTLPQRPLLPVPCHILLCSRRHVQQKSCLW